MKYILIDQANTYHRARHAAHRAATLADRVGFALHVTLSSIAKVWRDFGADHLVLVGEGRSWRRDVCAAYKQNRIQARAAASAEQQAEDTAFWQAHDDLFQLFSNHTNCTVLQHAQLEADDLIAGWIQLHPADQHLIVSSDSDYAQLITDQVQQYNGVSNQLTTTTGVFTDQGKPVLDRKTGKPKPAPDADWMLFEKCMRGDSTDNIFSAYPGVRKQGTRTRVGLLEAFADRESQGWAWNNLMLQRWTDHLGQEHLVRDDYERNRQLIDLSAQPSHIRELIASTVQSVQPLNRPGIGLHFLRFCGRHDLQRLSEQSEVFARIFSARLPESGAVTC